MRFIPSTLVVCACWPASMLAAAPTTAPTTQAMHIHAAYQQAVRDLARNFWENSGKEPHIRPTRAGNSTPTAADVGTVHGEAKFPSVWQLAQYANVLYWNWKLTHSPAVKSQLASEWAYVHSAFGDKMLSSAARADHIVMISDDAAWAINYLVQTHEVTGDAAALNDACELMKNTFARFADPATARVSYGSLQASPNGILYATPDDGPDTVNRSSLYEIMIANAALEIYAANHDKAYLDYAMATYEWTRQRLRHAEPVYYYQMLDLRPTVDGKKNGHYLKPLEDKMVPPIRGHSGSYGGGTLAMAVCAARLYKVTGDTQYLDEAKAIADDFADLKAFGRPGNLIVNEKGPWTSGHWAPYFAAEVLTLPGIDSTGTLRAAFENTGLAIAQTRTPEGYYTADWSGPEKDPKSNTMTWTEHAKRPADKTSSGMALPQQIMTSANSVAVITAAELLETHRPESTDK